MLFINVSLEVHVGWVSLYCTNDSELAQEPREIWMNENCKGRSKEKGCNLFIVHYMDACTSKG
jgi:hypothetical protein